MIRRFANLRPYLKVVSKDAKNKRESKNNRRENLTFDTKTMANNKKHPIQT